MEVTFRIRKLEKAYAENKRAEKAYGPEVARKYIQRINIIKKVKSIKELAELPGLRFHPLKGKHKGQYAIRLTGFYRLIFTLRGEQLEIVQIEEVSKHYGD